MMREGIPVKWIDYGLAYFDEKSKVILLNKHLRNKEHERLREELIKHELRHARGEKYVDLKQKPLPGFWKFIIKNPRALSHYLPWRYDKKSCTIYIRQDMLGFWLIMIGTITILYIAGKWSLMTP